MDFAGCIGADGEWLRKELINYGVGATSELLLSDPSVRPFLLSIPFDLADVLMTMT